MLRRDLELVGEEVKAVHELHDEQKTKFARNQIILSSHGHKRATNPIATWALNILNKVVHGWNEVWRGGDGCGRCKPILG